MSPITRTAPKTLRVVPTPKTELSAMTLPVAVRSTTSVVRPDTPGSEVISDSASIVSAGMSLSRASSPPPSRVGTAPLRTATKSQQRKARKELVKKDTESIVTTPKAEPEVEIAPITGRKKKQRKEKTVTASPAGTPTESRPGTPIASQAASAQVHEAKKTEDAKDDSSAYRSTAHETMSLTEDKPPVRVDAKAKGNESGESGNSDPNGNRLTSVQPTPSSTFQQLIEAGAFPGGIDSLSFVKPITGLNDKHHHGAQPSTSLLAKDLLEKDLLEPQTKSIVNEEDQASLLSGRAVRKLVDGLRVMLTPYGDCVRNLTPEEEDRFLALQERVAEEAASPAAFVSTRHEPAGGFSLIKGRAVPNGPPGYFPQAPGAYPQDPVNKIQREEAIYYINQYVLPRINLGTTGFPGSWKSAFPDGKVNLTRADLTPGAGGMTDKIAANLHTAASEFNSTMAPYMDTAAPELSYPAPAPGELHGHSQNIASVLVNHLGGNWPEGAGGQKFGGGAAAPPAATGGAGGGGPFGSVPLMSLEDAEGALAQARRETEKLEKSLGQVVKKNRRLLALGGQGVGIGAH